jgi:hypothetical protein
VLPALARMGNEKPRRSGAKSGLIKCPKEEGQVTSFRPARIEKPYSGKHSAAAGSGRAGYCTRSSLENERSAGLVTFARR